MSQSRRHHFVPRFYLEHFTDLSGRLQVFDKEKLDYFESSVGDAGHENHFHSLDDFPELQVPKDFDVEGWLAKLDTYCCNEIRGTIARIKASTFLSSTADRSLFLLDPESTNSLAFFVVLQWLRTREAREAIEQQSYLLHRQVFEWVKEELPPPEGFDASGVDVEVDPILSKLQHLRMLVDYDYLTRLASRLACEKVWVIGFNPTDIPLITSDHPVVMKVCEQRQQQGRGAKGFFAPGVEISIPLSPRIQAMIYCPTKVSNDSFYNIYRDRCCNLSADNVLYFNSLQIRESYRFLYGSTRLDYVTKIASEEPDWCDSARQRIAVNGPIFDLSLPADWRERRKRRFNRDEGQE